MQVSKVGLKRIGLLCLMVSGGSCKTRQAPRDVEKQAPEVIITMQNMVDNENAANSLLYTASDCGLIPSNSGVPKEGGKVSFRIKGIKAGDRCSVRVENPGASVQEIGFKADEGVLYAAKSVTIGQDLTGQFIGTAFLEKQYYYKGNQRYNLAISVKFDKNIRNSKLTGDLTCNPAIFLASDNFAPTSDNAGDFNFSAVAGSAPVETICTQLNIFENKKLIYTGNFKSPTFRPKAGDLVKLADTAVELKTAVTEPTGVIVETGTTNSSCKEGEYFNTETRRCEIRN